MNSSMPIPLIISWVFFFGFLNTHQRHAGHFQGASQGYLLALQASVILGCLVGLGLLVYYFIQVSWYWPLVLFIVGSLIGGIFFGFLDAKIGTFGMSLISFLGWPASAIWTLFIIRGLNP